MGIRELKHQNMENNRTYAAPGGRFNLHYKEK